GVGLDLGVDRAEDGQDVGLEQLEAGLKARRFAVEDLDVLQLLVRQDLALFEVLVEQRVVLDLAGADLVLQLLRDRRSRVNLSSLTRGGRCHRARLLLRAHAASTVAQQLKNKIGSS